MSQGKSHDEQIAAEIQELREALIESQARVSACEREIRSLDKALSDECANSLRLAQELAKVSEGDPVVVRPSDSLAESQAGLNGPSGSPTSPSGRASAASELTDA